MLDMGGAPSANSDQSLVRTVNASKNSRLQAVAFDFRLLINTNERAEAAAASAEQNHQEPSPPASSGVDADRVQQVAALLNVDLGSSHASSDPGTAPAPESRETPSPKELEDHNPSAHDIRAKYASKLKGGLAGIHLAKSQVEETLVSGDAAGHLAARKMAIMDGANRASDGDNQKGTATRWLPSLAATQLLTLLTHRSIRIVLLPILDNNNNNTKTKSDEVEPRMEDFKSQLKNVIIDNIVPKFDETNNSISDDRIETAMKKGIVTELDIDPNNILVVSDRESYLKVARDMGMNICRLRPKNARRGNITAHYTVETVAEVQDVVNEINGISFNTVLNR